MRPLRGVGVMSKLRLTEDFIIGLVAIVAAPIWIPVSLIIVFGQWIREEIS